MSLRFAVVLAAAALFAGAAAEAQEPASRPLCEVTTDANLPPELAGWRERAPLAAAAKVEAVGQATLPIGKGVDGQLTRNGEVVFPLLPGKPGGTISYGGLYQLAIAEAGDYQVSLGTGAWIEVVSGTTLVESTAHAPGPPCASLKKTVVFPLKPGRYVLEVSGNGEPVLAVMVTRKGP